MVGRGAELKGVLHPKFLSFLEPHRVPSFGNKAIADVISRVEMRSCGKEGGLLIQYDCCPYKKRGEDTDGWMMTAADI